MTLQKAIDILTGNTKYTISEFNEAVRLGFEALKYVRHTREIKVLDPGGRLPGETEK